MSTDPLMDQISASLIVAQAELAVLDARLKTLAEAEAEILDLGIDVDALDREAVADGEERE